MGARKLFAKLVQPRRKHTKKDAISDVVTDEEVLCPVRRQTPRTIGELAAAYERERRDADAVRKRLPSRIDELLFTEFRSCFNHDLYELIGKAAGLAASGSKQKAIEIARETLVEAAGCAAYFLDGFEARINARSVLSVGNDTTQLDDRSRADVLKRYADQLAEGVAAAVPRIARMATPEGAAKLRDETMRQLPCMQECCESLLLCKTQITDLYLDNDEVAQENQVNLLRNAVDLFESENLPEFHEADVASIVEFLAGTISSCSPEDALRSRAMSRLTAQLLSETEVEDSSSDYDAPWVSIAKEVLAAVAQRKLETLEWSGVDDDGQSVTSTQSTASYIE